MSAIEVVKHQRGTSADESPGAEPEQPLPEGSLVVIEPSKSWVPLNLRDIRTYREVLYFLVWRDVKVRYRQTLLSDKMAGYALPLPLPVFSSMTVATVGNRGEIKANFSTILTASTAGLRKENKTLTDPE